MRSWARWLTYAAIAIFVILVGACARAAPTPTPAPKAAAPPASAPAPQVAPAPTVAPAPRAAAPTPATAPAPAAAAAKKPKYGGILRTSTTSDAPSGWDPLYATGGGDSSYFYAAYSSLIRLDPRDGKTFIGDLAESWEVKDDGNTYLFRLRKNVVSHDGKAVDAEDVKLNIDRHVKRNPSQTWPSRVASTEVVDKYTVAIHLKTPFAAFASSLATASSIRLVPKHILEKIGGPDKRIESPQDVIGTGAFRFTGFSLGVGSTLVRFDKYFLEGKPYLDGITNIGIRDPVTRLAAYRTGNIDYNYAINIEGPEATFIKKNFPDHIVRQFTESRYWQFHMPNKPPWSDLRVRQALNLVFDRKAVIVLTEEGVGLVGSYISPKYGGLSEAEVAKLPGFRYPKDQDIQEAKRLLAQAGFTSGISSTIMYRNVPSYQDVALSYASQLEKALGFKFTPDLPPDDGAWKNRETNCIHSGFFHRNTTGDDPEDQMNAHISKAGYYRQKCGWDLPAVDKLYDEQRVTADLAKRTQILREIDKILSENLPFIQLHYSGYWASAWPFVKDSGLEVFNDIRADLFHVYTWLDK